MKVQGCRLGHALQRSCTDLDWLGHGVLSAGLHLADHLLDGGSKFLYTGGNLSQLVGLLLHFPHNVDDSTEKTCCDACQPVSTVSNCASPVCISQQEGSNSANRGSGKLFA